MSAATTVQVFRNGLGGRWQLPLAIASLAIFSLVIGRQVTSFNPVAFDEHLRRIEKLHEARELTRAGVYIKDLLKNPRRPQSERAELHRLYGKTAYLAESPLMEHQRQNIVAIISNFKTALDAHAIFAAEDWLAMGEAYRWSNKITESVAALRRALAAGLHNAESVRRQMVEMELSDPHKSAEKITSDLQEMLADERTVPADYLWAVVQELERLLEIDSVDEADALIKAGNERLANSPLKNHLTYCEALCLRARGKSDEAEAALRTFREELQQRDEFWGKSGWLLGRIQQEDNRPQLAITFYDEVLSMFSRGPIHQACALGRAESLAALGRYDAALDEFRALGLETGKEDIGSAGELESVRTTLVTIAESLRQDDQFEPARDYFELALKFTPKSLARERSECNARIADCLSSLASHQKSPKQDLLNQSGRLRIEAASLTEDEDRRIKLLELAADDFDAVGDSAQLIHTLSELTARHARHPGRPTALFRLGQAYRANDRYADAIKTFDEIITVYPRMPDALRSLVPLGDCLLRLGPDEQKRGIEILTGILNGTGPEQVFTPQAAEYQQALFTLAEFYSRADDKLYPNHHELAISRLEDAVSMYPDASQIPRLTFLLADAYRQSGLLLRKDSTKLQEAVARQRCEEQSASRIATAASQYEKVIHILAGEDAKCVDAQNEAYLQSSYLYRADCYFELGDFSKALQAYREAAWRYENLPVALNAGLQEVHCLERMGRGAECRSTLSRLSWLLKKMPASVFDTERGMTSKSYWQGLIDRMEQSTLN